MENNLTAAIVRVFSMLLYMMFIIHLWIWLFFKSSKHLQNNHVDVKADYTGFSELSFSSKCAYLYVRMWLEVIAIVFMAFVVVSTKDEEIKEAMNYKADKAAKFLWLGNKVAFIFIIAFSVAGGILITSIINFIK